MKTRRKKEDKDYWEEALNSIACKTVDLNSLITKRITLEEAVDPFKFYNRKKDKNNS